MPLYEFDCSTCNKRVEILVMSGDTPVCPRCGGRDLERCFSTFASPGLSGGHGCGSACSCPPGSCSTCSCH